MPMTISAISRLIARLTQRPKSEEQKLEELLSRTIPFLTHERELITTSREKIRLWGDVVEDYNAIHRIPEKAIEYGKMFGLDITDTPIMGTHTAAYAEKFAERLIQLIKEQDEKGLELKIIGQSTKFTGFVYPEEGIRWELTEPKGPALELPIKGSVKGREIADVTIKIGLDYKEPPKINETPIYQRDRFILDEERLKDSNQCLAFSNNGEVHQTLPDAFVVATLLSLLREQTGRMTGLYGSMNFDYFAKPKLNQDISVLILPSMKPKAMPNQATGNTQYLYIIEALCKQNNMPITKGKVRVITPYLIDLTKPLYPKQ